MRTGGVHRRERPALRRTFVRGPTSQFSISLIAQFVVKPLLGSPAEVRTRGVAMKRLALTAEFSAIALAWTIAVPARAYEAGAVAGGGKIDGKVVFNDAVPTRKIIPNKDVEVCGGIREEPLIAVGPDKGVQNAVVYLVEVAKGKAWPAAGK